MSGTQDPWAAFPVVSKGPDPWSAFPVVNAPVSASPEVKAEPPSAFSSTARALDNFVRSVAAGATFGGMDELSAGARRVTEGVPYEAALGEERARDAEYRKQHPYLSAGGNILGAAISPLNRFMPFKSAAGSLSAAIGKGALTGAAAGSIAGFLSGEGGFDRRASEAAKDAALGGVVGASMPALVAGGRGIYNLIAPYLGGKPAETQAQRLILRDLARDEVTPDELLARSQTAAQANRPAMMADLAGDNLQQTAQVVARTPGPGQSLAGEAVRVRGGAAQTERLAGDIRENVSGVDFRDATEKLLTARSQTAAPLYERAWQAQVPTALQQQLAPILGSKNGQDALQRGMRQMEEEGRAAYLGSVRNGAPNPGVLFDPAKMPQNSLRMLDAVKRGLDNILEGKEARNEVTGRLTAYGRSIEDQRRNLVGVLKENFPDYANALNAWAGPSAAMDAMRMGRQLVSSGPEAFDRFSQEIAKLDAGGKDFAAIGMARALLDRLGSAGDAQELTKLRRMMGTPAVRDRIRSLIGGGERFDKLMNTFDQELRMASTNAAISPRGGSPTMPMGERLADLRSPPRGVDPFVETSNAPAVGLGEDLLRTGASGGFTSVPFRMGVRGLDAARELGYRANTERMAPYLFSTDPGTRDQMIRELMARALRDQELSQAMRPAAHGLNIGIPAGVAMQQ